MNRYYFVFLIMFYLLPSSASSQVNEWSDIDYVEGSYSRIYFDYIPGVGSAPSRFHCINDWIVNQDDGGVSGGLLPIEYNLFNFRVGTTDYEIRIYPDSAIVIPNTLENFTGKVNWTTSPNEPVIDHTIWEFSFDIPPTALTRFLAKDPPGGAITVYENPPAPSIITDGPSFYPHYTDGSFADLLITPGVIPVPARPYQDPVADPHLPLYHLELREPDGVRITPCMPDTIDEWSDIDYIEGAYSRIYFDYQQSSIPESAGTFYVINDWIVNQDDGGDSGGLKYDEYNLFNFTIGTTDYEIRIYADGSGTVEPPSLELFSSACSWVQSPNEPCISHTIWEFSFSVPPMVLSQFKPKDPPGPQVVVFEVPPPPGIVQNPPSEYEHFTDGGFADEYMEPVLPPDPTRSYQEPIEDPHFEDYYHNVILHLGGGTTAEAVFCQDIVDDEQVDLVRPMGFAARPNPFDLNTVLNYTLKEAGEVRISVFDANGRLVRHLLTATKPAGSGSVEWDGNNDDGDRVSPGIYFCRMSTPGGIQTPRVVVIQ